MRPHKARYRVLAKDPLLTGNLAYGWLCDGRVSSMPEAPNTMASHGLAHLMVGTAALLAIAGCSSPATTAPTEAPAAIPTATQLSGLRFSTRGWKTNFSIAQVPLAEIESGGPARDGIPPIDQPKFVTAAEAGDWLKDQEPVVALELRDDARAYPLQILIWHEIVDDVVGGAPTLITFCPLCNTAIAFDRRVDGHALRFGTTGNLRRSDLVMWSDDPGETWWQQITGSAIVGDLVGRRLTMLSATIVSLADFKAAYPHGRILSRDTGHPRGYGSNPYVGYDDVNGSPLLYSGPTDGRLPPMERVATVDLNGETVAYPFSKLSHVRAVNDVVGGAPVVVLHQGGTVSALDGPTIAASRDVGAAAVFARELDGRLLTFSLRDDRFVDDQTGSTWDILGRATGGALAGSRLHPIVSANHFWFAWAVFKPETRIWAP
jgi:hypothetical protein